MSTAGFGRTTFLDSFRAITIIMVVAIHARGRVDLTPSLESTIYFVVGTIAVPSFFLCDGYLYVLRGAQRLRVGYIDYVRRSARRLLIPWLVFSVFYTIVRGAFEWVGALDQQVVWGRHIWDVAVEVYTSGIAPQMYFLVSLFFIRCISVAFTRLVGAHRVVPWVTFLGYSLAYRTLLAAPLHDYFSVGFDPMLHAAWGLQFYLLGIALARIGPIDSGSARWLSVAGFAVLCGLLVFDLTVSWPGATQYSYLLGAFFGFVALGEGGRLLARFGSDSMGVYLLHAPVLLYAVAWLLGSFVASPLVLYLSTCATATALSWLGAVAMKSHGLGRWLMGMTDRPAGRDAVARGK